MTIKEIVLSDEYLTSNIKADLEPDALGLVGPGWAEEYDLRMKLIRQAVARAIWEGEVIDDGFSCKYIPSKVPKYTGAEVVALMNEYHELISGLERNKEAWLNDQVYNKQDYDGWSYKDLLERLLRDYR